MQVKANDELTVSGPVDAEPDGSREPLQLPDAVHDSALVDVQFSVAEDPDATEAGVADRETVGTAGSVGRWVTLAVTVWPAVPPVPEQVSVYSVLLASAPVASLPLVPFPPLHPPDATQAAALVDDHVRLADAACWTVDGVTANDRVGAGAGVGVEGVDGGEGVVEGESPPPPPQPINVATITGNALRISVETVRFTSTMVRRVRVQPAWTSSPRDRVVDAEDPGC